MPGVNHQIDRTTRLCISLAARPTDIGTRFHNYLYEALDLNFVYKAFAPLDIADAVLGIRGLGIRGAAVSMPYKQQVMPLLDSLDESASAISAVNTIVNTDGHLRGYNTDYSAMCNLLGKAGVGADARVLLLGSGGMANAVAAALHSLGVQDAVVVARNAESGGRLAARHGFTHTTEFGQLRGDVVINATPVGMAGGAEADQLPCPLETALAASLVVDVVAVPAETPLLAAALAAGISVIRGVDIMTLQAVEQFVLYTGIRPSAELVAAAQIWSRQ